MYSFKLQCDAGNIDVFPDYGSDLEKIYSLVSEQMFYRADLNGKIIFKTGEYDLIQSSDFDTKFILTTYKNSVLYHTGYFYKTDCKFDVDSLTVEVKIHTEDEYTEILDGMDREFNLVRLAVSTNPITIKKRPLLQVYAKGDSIITNFLGGNYWEQACETVTDAATLTGTYKFALGSQSVSVTTAGLTVNVYGSYDPITLIRVGDGTYKFIREVIANGDNTAGDKTVVDIGSIWRKSDTTEWKLIGVKTGGTPKLWFKQYGGTGATLGNTTLVHVSGATHTSSIGLTNCVTGSRWMMQVVATSQYVYGGWTLDEIDVVAMYTMAQSTVQTFTPFVITVYTRYLCDAATFDGTATSNIPTSDIIDPTAYTKVAAYSVDNIYTFHVPSSSPTEYGQLPSGCVYAGYYYIEPDASIVGAKMFPIARHLWGCVSLWFYWDSGLNSIEYDNSTSITLRDAYKVSSVLKVLVEELSAHTHTESSGCSQFFYATVNPIDDEKIYPFITPKTNITKGEYDQPAQKATITLKDVLDMLRTVWRVYWHVESGLLRLEHVSWYTNGGSYSASPVVGTDLTLAKDMRNNLPLAFGQSQYYFEKVNMPEKIKYSWMDDVSYAFTGYPIELLSGYVEKGNIIERAAGNFTPDIDYLMCMKDTVSKDGFALIAAKHSTYYYAPFLGIEIFPSTTIWLQNLYCCWLYLHPHFHKHDLPATAVKINDSATTALGTIGYKIQEVVFPLADSDPDPIELIKTYVGEGKVDKLSINFSSLQIKATLRHDTE